MSTMDEDVEGESHSTLTLVSTAVACGLLASLMLAAPALIRARASVDPSHSFLNAWLALSAVGLLPATLLIGVFRALRRDTWFGARHRFLRIGSWCLTLALATAMNVLVGALLRKTTHHVGLAGATYGVTSGVSLLFAILASHRLRVYFATVSEQSQRIYALACVIALSGMAALCFLRMSRSLGDSLPEAIGSAILDAATLLVLAVLGSQASLSGMRLLKLVGPPLALVTLGIGLWIGFRTGNRSVFDHAPLHRLMANLVRP
jgi:hypothetical protein